MPVHRSKSREVLPEAKRSSTCDRYKLREGGGNKERGRRERTQTIIMMSCETAAPKKSHCAKYTSSNPAAGPGAENGMLGYE
jgi:hypothetical protein